MQGYPPALQCRRPRPQARPEATSVTPIVGMSRWFSPAATARDPSPVWLVDEPLTKSLGLCLSARAARNGKARPPVGDVENPMTLTILDPRTGKTVTITVPTGR